MKQEEAVFLMAGRRTQRGQWIHLEGQETFCILGRGLVTLNWCTKSIHKAPFASLKPEMSSQIAEVGH